MVSVVDEAIEKLDSLIEWLEPEAPINRRYPWSEEEDNLLRHLWGRVSRPELVRRCSTVLQRVIDDSEAVRTPEAYANRAAVLGLEAYNGEPDEIYLGDAARLCDLPYDTLYRAVQVGELDTERRGKKRYVTYHNLALWFVAYRERMLAQSEALWLLEGDTISKPDTMALTGLSETHITRYLSTGVIRAWKVPDLSAGDRGYWYVDRESAEAFVRIRAEGGLQELLVSNPVYVALRDECTAEVSRLRRAGRLRQRDPLTDPQSRYHPGCFAVKQVASHVGLSTQVVYKAIERGRLKAEIVDAGGRNRYGVRRAEAHRYARWVNERDWPIVHYHNRQRQQIAEAGLLTVRDLAERWSIDEETIRRYVREGSLPARRWGRYLVFEPTDVEDFEELL